MTFEPDEKAKPIRRRGKVLTNHVPVRFPPEMIVEVKRLAEQEGLTVSTWIRRAVSQAIRKEQTWVVPSWPSVTGSDPAPEVTWKTQEAPR